MIPLSRATVTDEMKRAMLDVVDSGRFILGPQTRAFEEEFARYVGTAHAVAVSQGTSAIQLAILSIGVRPGDEVLVPSMTAFPTVEGVVHGGATPVFVDCDDYGCIDPQGAEASVTARTVGISLIARSNVSTSARRSAADRSGRGFIRTMCDTMCVTGTALARPARRAWPRSLHPRSGGSSSRFLRGPF